jgi:two-component system, sensor histidine kinase PdtaS
MEGIREQLAYLAAAAKRYIRLPLGEVDYHMIVTDLIKLSGAKHTAVNLFLPEQDMTVTKALGTSSSILKEVEKILGFALLGQTWPLEDYAREWLYSPTTICSGSLHEVCQNQMALPLVKQLERLFRVGDVYAIGLREGDQILGNLVMIMGSGAPAPETELIDTFAEMVVQLLLRKDAEKALQNALSEKELILRESHHRIKNNLSLVASLVSLQQKVLPREASGVLTSLSKKIQAIVLIHEQLHSRKSDGSSIYLDDYLRRLSDDLQDSFWSEDIAIRLELAKTEPLRIKDDRAIPLGIIVTELVLNAVKHAFPDRRRGTITLEYSLEGSKVQLSVRDDGVGFSGGRDIGEQIDEQIDSKVEKSESIGMMLVDSLTQQLDGTITRRNLPSGGAEVLLLFPLEEPASA